MHYDNCYLYAFINTNYSGLAIFEYKSFSRPGLPTHHLQAENLQHQHSKIERPHEISTAHVDQ